MNCLLIHGIPENKDEGTDVLALEVLDTKMELKITQNDIDITHKIGIPKANCKRRPGKRILPIKRC